MRVFVSSNFRDMKAERDELAKRVFPRLRELCASRGVTFLEVDLRWGLTSETAAQGNILPILLADIDSCRPYFVGLLGERYGWVPEAVEPPELLEQYPWLAEHVGRSIMELEFLHGALIDPTRADGAFFYLRDPAYIETLPPEERSAYREPSEFEFSQSGSADAERRTEGQRSKLADLKARIAASGLPVRLNYPDPHALGELVLADFTSLIERLYPAGYEPDPLETEAHQHEGFARTLALVYIIRAADFEALDAHAAGSGPPLVVLGESGAGKSALLANWADRYRSMHPDEPVIEHFIGVSPTSTDWRAMVRRIIGELNRRFGFETQIPERPAALRQALATCLNTAAARGRVVLIVDALGQLEDRDGAADLVWLPPVIPDNVRLILSTLPGRPLAELERRGWPTLRVAPLEPVERERLIIEYLASYRKTLDPPSRHRIASSPQCANPLFVRALLDELRLFGVPEMLHERIERYLDAQTVEQLYESILSRYEADYERDRAGLVRDAFALLLTARSGLSESELLELLGADGEPLPRDRWYPLFLAADQSLIRPAGLIRFSNNYLREAVTHRYLWNEELQRTTHRRIAGYFRAKADPATDRTWTGNSARGMGELPYHLGLANEVVELCATLADVDFLERKAQMPNGVDQIQDDFNMALRLVRDEPRALLEVIDRAMRRDEDLLHRAPDLVWQQLACRPVRQPDQANGPASNKPETPGSEGRSVARAHVPRAADDAMNPTTPGARSRSARFAVIESIGRAITREAHVLTARPELLWQQVYNRVQWEPDPIPATFDRELDKRTALDCEPWLWDQVAVPESRALIQTMSGHTLPVTACAISPDGASILTASADNTMKLWDAASGTERATLKGHEGTVTECAISGDRSFIVSASHDGTLKIWDAASGIERATLTGHSGAVTGCSISPDGAFVVSASQDRTAKIWDTAMGTELATLRGHSGRLTSCAISPCGTFIVTASRDGSLRIWDAKTAANVATLTGHGDAVSDCAISPDGALILSASFDGTLKVWDRASGLERSTFRGHTEAVEGCAFSPDGGSFVSASSDRTLKVWDLRGGVVTATLLGHTRSVLACDVSPDGTLIASGSNDATVKAWAMMGSGGVLATPRRHRDAVWDCAVSPDGAYIVSASGDDTLKIWDANGFDLRANLAGHLREVNGCAVSPDGAFVVSASEDGMLKVWDSESGANVLTLAGHAAAVLGCAISPDGAFVVSAGEDRSLRVWDSATGAERFALFGHSAAVNSCAVGPDGTFIVSASEDETLKVWDSATGAERFALFGHSAAVNSCAVSPDGTFIVSASEDGTLKVWDSSSGAERLTLAGHTTAVNGCAVSPDGAFIVSASDDSTLRVWDSRLGKALAVAPMLGRLSCVALYPSRSRTVSGDVAGSLNVHEMVGISYGPIIVTARDLGGKLSLICPACRLQIVPDRDQLGQTVVCPSRGCNTRLRLNPFTLKPVAQ